MSKTVMLATTNRGKVEEFKRMLSPLGIDLVVPDRKLEIQEGDCSFLENAYIKAKEYYNLYRMPTIADDSGLVIKALNGFPGVFSSRFYSHPFGGVQELKDSEDRANIEKTLKLLKDAEDRSAYFICYVVLYTKDSGYFGEGKVEGRILESPRGDRGFGYDPIFLPENYDLSMAELSPEEKDKISHRGKAIRKLLETLRWV